MIVPAYPDFAVRDIDPDLARELLVSNTRNRNLRHRVVASYAADMAAGAWRENGESIKIAADGTIVDGQHRLHAIIESDTKQRMLVVTGLPMDAQDTVDGGAKRSFADVLKLRGEPRYVSVAAIARRVEAWVRGHRTTKGNYVPTTTQLLAALEEFPDIRLAAEVADGVRTHIPIPASALGLCHWLFMRIQAADADERSQLHEDVTNFFDRLRDGADLAANHPIAVLRRTAIENMTSKSRLNEVVMTAYVIKAWNAYRDGRTMSLLRFRVGGATPESFPEPK